ncbi:MAG: cytochrome c biogenesis protein ResB [Candidatus Omnitrophica bacterium]|nr:cytochrome c biogenesis protein ResB [Candidatus Omnitrophota bacterium]
MNGLIKFLGSVRFTVVTSVGLIILLVISTSMESINGTPYAQKVFYNTRWFDLVISLLWINIFCSTILRFPFKKNQIGFLITHISILGLLAGALISRTHGIDGEMTVYENETADSIRQDGNSLTVIFPDQHEARFDLKKGAVTLPRPGVEGLETFYVNSILMHAAENRVISAGNSGAVNHAIEVKVQSKQLALNSSQWLIERETGNPASDSLLVGPLKLILRQKIKPAAPAVKPLLHVLDKKGKELLSVDVDVKDLSKKIPIAKTGLVIKDLAYYPYASVADKKLINFPEGKKLNPAVVYFLVDSKGVETRQVKFAFYPEFESMHPQDNKKAPDVQIRFEAGESAEAQDLFDGLQVGFTFGDKDLWRFQTAYQNKVLKEGDVSIGNCVSSGWNDVEFCVSQISSFGKISYDIIPAKNDQGPLAVSLTVPSLGNEPFWVYENKSTLVHLPKADINFAVTPKMQSVPFSITLKKFRKIDYPGTMDAAGFESDVSLKDPKQGITLERTISMNHPLEYNGYKIFQSSYFSDPQFGQASVFTVARNPGIPWIYISSLFALIGALIQFYGTKKEEK